jgi:hypothetical protein
MSELTWLKGGTKLSIVYSRITVSSCLSIETLTCLSLESFVSYFLAAAYYFQQSFLCFFAKQSPTIRKTIRIIKLGTATAITITTFVIDVSVFSAIVLMVSVTYSVIVDIIS